MSSQSPGMFEIADLLSGISVGVQWLGRGIWESVSRERWRGQSAGRRGSARVGASPEVVIVNRDTPPHGPLRGPQASL